jgi:hypothetical protein
MSKKIELAIIIVLNIVLAKIYMAPNYQNNLRLNLGVIDRVVQEYSHYLRCDIAGLPAFEDNVSGG